MTKKTLTLIILTFILTACASTAETSAPPAAPQLATIDPTTVITEAVPTEPAPTEIFVTETAALLANERTSPIDGMPQVYVSAGSVRMGGLDVYADDRDELPAHEVTLDAFWIDKLEVTNAMYMLCVQAGDCTSPGNWESDRRKSYFNNEEFKDYPVVRVSWEQANVYCTWAERRLPTEAEWERAARGDDFRNYPWGDEPPSGVYANYNRLIGDTTRVGSYAAGASPFGALDMAGNVWEWVADFYGIEYYKISPEHNPTGPESNSTNLRVIRGGSFQDRWVDLRVSKRGAAFGPSQDVRLNDSTGANEVSSKIGFRCLADE